MKALFVPVLLNIVVSSVTTTYDDPSVGVCTVDDSREECSNLSDSASADEEDAHCVDKSEDCSYWSEMGECEGNPAFMLKDCCKSCNEVVTSGPNKSDNVDEDDGLGVPQLIVNYHESEIEDIIKQAVAYMKEIVNVDPKYEPVRDKCRNNNEHCSFWALDGGCFDNPKYMNKECAPACQSCDFVLELEEKCRLDPNGVDAMEAGGMNAMFERMIRVSEERGFEPMVHSRPFKSYSSSCDNDTTNPCNTPDGPWVLTLENFISPTEIHTLLEWGSRFNYERSQAGDVISDSRTSSHTWCVDGCYDDPTVASLRQRIVDVTGISEENYECLQLLKYEVGEFYRPHDDFIDDHVRQAKGPRRLTFFIYFNEVEEGGGTRFPKLGNLTIQPKLGRVLIWPSVLDGDAYKKDERTNHEAMEVTKGRKFAANAWIHLRDFQSGFELGCPG